MMRDRDAAASVAAVQRDAGLLAAAGATQEHGQVLSRAPHQRAFEADGTQHRFTQSHATCATFKTPALDRASLTSLHLLYASILVQMPSTTTAGSHRCNRAGLHAQYLEVNAWCHVHAGD